MLARSYAILNSSFPSAQFQKLWKTSKLTFDALNSVSTHPSKHKTLTLLRTEIKKVLEQKQVSDIVLPPETDEPWFRDLLECWGVSCHTTDIRSKRLRVVFTDRSDWIQDK